jgi:hypothetical protein
MEIIETTTIEEFYHLWGRKIAWLLAIGRNYHGIKSNLEDIDQRTYMKCF